ncbi:high-affinity choline transporter 1-like [Elysia marginata]|uniref:High-affinity choline transporter 1-like n=1 Tax=Elysia marginata TaxID=1093978 RepID=A0AAV4IAU9_9GAST|nr:high-affinity choline transporter 1-like [Elysia marginata]
MAVNVAAVVVLVLFYLAILAVGLLAAYKVKSKTFKGEQIGELETSLVAGRDLKTSVGIFTMIATTVGGGFINGTAEEVARAGLVWTLAPLGIFIGLNLGGAVYAKKMRSARYLTMLDPFQVHHGNLVTFLIYSASLVGDLLWTASILNALGLFMCCVLFS